MSRTRQTSPGFTFVELLISLVILSIVGVVAANAIVTATDADRVARSRSRNASVCREAYRIVSRDVANIACGKIHGRQPYSETSDPDSPERIMQLLVTPPDYEVDSERDSTLEALLIRYVVRENEDRTWRLERGMADLATDGTENDFIWGVIADRCHAISFDPVVEGDSEERILKRIDFVLTFTSPGVDRVQRVALTARSPIEKSKEGS